MVKNFWGALTAFAAALFLPQPAFAAGLNGAELSIGWVLPLPAYFYALPSALWQCRISGTAITAR